MAKLCPTIFIRNREYFIGIFCKSNAGGYSAIDFVFLWFVENVNMGGFAVGFDLLHFQKLYGEMVYEKQIYNDIEICKTT